uniref:fimbrial biogenesis chaperone n=1 Tax=Castellaniella defragrans TaxID=75697 RepID=UPI003341DEBA
MLAVPFVSAVSHASVVISGTRVIYHEANGEKTLKLTNKGQRPSLVQSWLDTAGASPIERGSLDVPFIVSPPTARIDPGKSQTVRIVYSGEPLPRDRESVFYLNVLEVPPKANSGPDDNLLSFSLHSRIKFFFRPTGLADAVDEAPARLIWQLVTSGGQPVLRVSNPTSYHISFHRIELAAGGQIQAVKTPGMLAPQETRDLVLPQSVVQPAGAQVRYQVVNDYGNILKVEAVPQALVH